EKHRVAGEHERAVLPFLYDHELRAALHDPLSGLHEVVVLRELTRFGVVQRDRVDALEQLEQLGAPALDPEVHRVTGNQPGLVDLREHIELESWIDVAEKDEWRRAELRRNLGAEVREHAEVRLEGFRHVEVVTVAAAPAEGAPG